MAEQSSTVTTFRATVMLLCVVLIPLAAVCGTSCPGVVKAIQDGRLPTWADFRSAGGPRSGESEAPPFVPQGSSAAPLASLQAGAGIDPRAQAAGFSPQQPGTSASQFPAAPRPNGGGSDVVPISYDSPAWAGLGGVQKQSTTFPPRDDLLGKNFAAEMNRGLSPTSPRGVPQESPERTASATGYGNAITPSAANDFPPNGRDQLDADAQFRRVQDRLRQLGASYYLLETCGDRKDEYRFYCKMSMGGSSNLTRAFECIDTDPLKAMTNVLQQVEQWQVRGGASSVEPARFSTQAAP